MSRPHRDQLLSDEEQDAEKKREAHHEDDQHPSVIRDNPRGILSASVDKDVNKILADVNGREGW